ncbi:MAG: sigma-54-dependent Fis family transcriptional regulator [Deltaproteobacteria bacterium]|nr:sigma-54-dependent Fis family transcriptional regulator [Deltaproteobacteria bacterium]
MNPEIQIIEDDRNLAMVLSRILTKEGYDVSVGHTVSEGKARLGKGEIPDLILTDIYLPDGSGLELLEYAKSVGQDVSVIVMTANATVETAIEAMKMGAIDYLLKPFQVEELVLTLRRICNCRALQAENRFLKEGQKNRFFETGILGVSDRIREILSIIASVSANRASVLIEGESGTGKELIAQAIHFTGNRSGKMFVPINCSAIPDNLLESELFGHVKGAFTGAMENKQGLFLSADGGTLFLDEIGDLSPALQAKLLRVLHDGRIRRVGDCREIVTDVRIVAATNKDLPVLIRKGEFREDLYFRLAVIPIRVPPLRERREDIPILVEHFLRLYFSGKAPEVRFSENALRLLLEYPWPGNVRELKNLVERFAILKRGQIIGREDLPAEFHPGGGRVSPDAESALDYRSAKRQLLDDFHRRIVVEALKKHGGNVSRASDSLGLDRGNFQRIMRRLGVQSSGFRGEE